MEVVAAIKSPKKNKATGRDKIKNEMWIEAKNILLTRLCNVLNNIWNEIWLPEEWISGIIVPIYKKGKINEVKNFRGVSLMDSGYKIYSDIIREKTVKRIITVKNI